MATRIKATRVSAKVQNALEAKGYSFVQGLKFKTCSGEIYRTVINGKRAVVVGIYNLALTGRNGGTWINYRGYAKFID